MGREEGIPAAQLWTERLRSVMVSAMPILHSRQTLAWGQLNVPVFGLERDWWGEGVRPAAGWCLVVDARHLWLIATRAAPPRPRPEAPRGAFFEGLWEGDVAELFLGHPRSPRYLELNLAPHGGWWACRFDAARQRSAVQPDFSPWVQSHAGAQDSLAWTAALQISRAFLEEELEFGPDSPLNVNFILHSPEPQYLSVAELGGGEPDFHRPQAFRPMPWVEVDAADPS